MSHDTIVSQSSSENGPAASKAAKGRSVGIRRYFAIEDNARAVAFTQSTAGRLVLFLLFVPVFARIEPDYWLPMTLGAALCAYTGRYRSYALPAATFVVLGLQTSGFGLYPFDKFQAVAHAVFFTFSLTYLLIARHYQKLFVSRRPVVTLLCLITFLVGITHLKLNTSALEFLWAFIKVLCKYIWFLAYALVDQRARSCSPLYFQFGTFHPFWGSTGTPIGKGAAYLRKTVAKTPEQLAVTQIKGLKLLYWSLVLSAIVRLMNWLMYSQFHLPHFADVEAAHVAGHPYAITVGWATLIYATAMYALKLAIYGHRVVAIARLAGFRLNRNTWRPLESQTLVDLWSRYFFYFKELLVEFFFLPTFLSTFKNHPRLRVFFATFMAAGVGNAIYHFLRDIKYVRSDGLWHAIVSFESYIFYCVVLATGIGISQARTHRRTSSVIGWLWSFTCVWSFVVLLFVFGDETRVYTLGERMSFLFSLFGAK